MRNLAFLAAATSLWWLVLIGPGWVFWGNQAFLHSLTALGLCLFPALVTLGWALRQGSSPDMLMMAVLGGTGVRLTVALGIGFLLYRLFPEDFPQCFWLWVGVFYLFVLALEVILVVRVLQKTPVR